MTLREMNLRVFRGEPLPRPFFQPRLEPWFDVAPDLRPALAREPRRAGSAASTTDLGVSMRYMEYYTGVPKPVVRELDDEVGVREVTRGKRRTVVYETPHGELVEDREYTVDHTWRTVGFPVRTRDDLRAPPLAVRAHALSLRPHASSRPATATSGISGAPQFYLPKSPYQALAQQWMKLADLVYAIEDFPAEVESVMKAIDASYDPLYEEIAASGCARIVNFGENIHEQLLSPSWFER